MSGFCLDNQLEYHALNVVYEVPQKCVTCTKSGENAWKQSSIHIYPRFIVRDKPKDGIFYKKTETT